MSNTLLQNLNERYETCRSVINSYTTTAAEQGRSMSDQEVETVRGKQTEMKDLQKQIDLLNEQEELARASAGNLANVHRSASTEPATYGSVGELIRARLDAPHSPETAVAYTKAMQRAAQHMGTTAANTFATAGGMPGLLIQKNVGPVIDLSPKGRPLLSALGVQPATDPLSFRRPRLVDPDFRTGAAVQSKEKAELASKKFDVNADTVDLVTIGGYLNISAQLQAMPIGALDLSYSQLRRRVENATEAAAVTALLAGADESIPLAANATAANFLAAVFDASAAVYDETGELATWIAMGPRGWARIGKMTDGDTRPYFPTLGATNAPGTVSAGTFTGGTIAGLQPVVSHGFSGANADTFVVGNSLAMEAYEYAFPLFQAQEPSVLGTQIAVAVAFGTYRPAAGAAVALKPATTGASARSGS